MALLLALASILLAGCHITLPSDKSPPSDTTELHDTIARLQKDSRVAPALRFEAGIATFAIVDVSLPPATPDDSPHRALEFVARYQQLYRLQETHQELFLTRVVEDAGQTKVVFGQKVGTVPVFGAYLAVRAESDRVRGTSANLSPRARLVKTTARLSRDQAEQAVRKAGVLLDQGRVISQLTILDPALLGETDTHAQLAWRVGVSLAPNGLSADYFVSAEDGTILRVIDRKFDIDFSVRNAVGTSLDTFSCRSFRTFVEVQNESGPTAAYEPSIPDAAIAPSRTRATYAFFSNIGFRSFDNRDSRVDVGVNFDFCPGPNNANAFYTPACNQLMFDPGLVLDDVFGHEFTHGVVEHTAGLINTRQPGAANESMADVFGALIEGRNWLVAEGFPGGPFRDMANPPAHSSRVRRIDRARPCAMDRPVCGTFAHPDHMRDLRLMDDDCDNGGVHINSGIMNKAGYLIARGGTHSERTVQGIGEDKLGHLYLATLRGLGSSAGFMAIRDEVVAQAESFVRLGLHGFTDTDVCSVRKAFFTVGLGEDCGYRPRDRDGDYVEDEHDTCPDIWNPRQENVDGDDRGNACDPDIDGDGVPNGADSCPTRPNIGERDDGDGIDCACDDSDEDGSYDCRDNCWQMPNPDQSNIDGDELGDACDDDIDGDHIPNADDQCPRNVDSGHDGDGDGVDDVCDLCPQLNDLAYDPDGPPGPNSRFNIPPGRIEDLDEDGVGDPCDPDDDNDGICDVVATSGGVASPPAPSTPGLPPGGCVAGPRGVDNCPTTANREQFDVDDNGRGLLCDGDEADLLDGNFVAELRGVHRFTALRPRLLLPVDVCAADGPGCPMYLDGKSTVTIHVTVPNEQVVSVIDQAGRLVSAFRAGPRGGKITLPADPALHFVAAAHTKPFSGNRWFVELQGPARPADRAVAFSMNVETD